MKRRKTALWVILSVVLGIVLFAAGILLGRFLNSSNDKKKDRSAQEETAGMADVGAGALEAVTLGEYRGLTITLHEGGTAEEELENELMDQLKACCKVNSHPQDLTEQMDEDADVDANLILLAIAQKEGLTYITQEDY